ncbi:MAG: BBP7 family outer membrane beta-barrel protein [Planctomycetota bacterium]|nr:BBP7 family outer membrane beta-barrel protein [Planctomycetota bacterium]
MKPLRTTFIIVSLVLVHSGMEASADQYRRSASGASPAARAEYTASESFHNFIGDEPTGLPTSYQPDAVVEGTPACSGGCTNSAACDSAACGSAACGRSLIWDPWVTFEYMHAWRKGRSLPALVTSSPPGTNGILPGSDILFGNGEIGGDLKSAGRLSFGAWLDEDRVLGVGGKFFATARDSTSYSRQSDGSQLLARPYFDSDPFNPTPSAWNVANASFGVQGDVQARASNDLLTAEAYGSYLLYACRGRRLDFIAGYQFARIDDSLVINSRSTDRNSVTVELEDAFSVKNTFNGGELGLLGQYDAGPITFSALGKLGLGNMHQVVTIDGRYNVNPLGASGPGGLLTQPTNINPSPYTSNKFCVVPEADLKMIYHMTRRFDFSLGYSLIYWDKVALAGDQIDTSREGMPTVNSSQLLGGPFFVPPNNPELKGIRDTSFWVQGITIGLTFKL